MADKEIHQVRLHYGSPAEYAVAILFSAALIGGMLYWTSRTRSERDNAAPFFFDLRNEGAPVNVEITDNGPTIARIERADGIEARIYGAQTGKLVGTIWAPKATTQAPEPE